MADNPPPAEHRALQARLGAYESWARTSDRAARTAPARRAALDRFARQVDPTGGVVVHRAERHPGPAAFAFPYGACREVPGCGWDAVVVALGVLIARYQRAVGPLPAPAGIAGVTRLGLLDDTAAHACERKRQGKVSGGGAR